MDLASGLEEIDMKPVPIRGIPPLPPVIHIMPPHYRLILLDNLLDVVLQCPRAHDGLDMGLPCPPQGTELTGFKTINNGLMRMRSGGGGGSSSRGNRGLVFDL